MTLTVVFTLQAKFFPVPFPQQLLMNCSAQLTSLGMYQPHAIVLFDIGTDPYHYTAALKDPEQGEKW